MNKVKHFERNIKILEKMAKSSDFEDRREVAQNPYTPVWILEEFTVTVLMQKSMVLSITK